MPKQSDSEGIARVLDGPDVVAAMQTLVDVSVEESGEGDVQKVLIIESVVLEDHDVRREEGVLQIGVLDIARPYGAQGAETPLELWVEAQGVVDGGMGETAGEGGAVELAVEDAAVETGIVVRVEELVEETTCKHERQEQARGRG